MSPADKKQWKKSELRISIMVAAKSTSTNFSLSLCSEIRLPLAVIF
jgi:hypothetical protein